MDQLISPSLSHTHYSIDMKWTDINISSSTVLKVSLSRFHYTIIISSTVLSSPECVCVYLY